MISCFLYNKSDFRKCEDTLTASVFDLLKYLPVDIFWSILKKSVYYDKLPLESGELQDIEFWARWCAKDTNNTNFVEPDVFLRFNNFDVIIEAKRYDQNQQSKNQRYKEITSYLNEYEKDKKDLYFLQVGGLNNLNDSADIEIKSTRTIVCKTDWTRILSQIIIEKRTIESISYSHLNSYKRIFNDLIRSMEVHGFFQKSWLQDLNSDRVNNIDSFNYFCYAKK